MALRTERVGAGREDTVADLPTVQLLCEPGVVQSVVQPVVRPADQLIVGYEALARMPLEPAQPPDWWLARAEEVGLRAKLELACLTAAVTLGPTPDNRLLFVNLSPSLLAHPAALRLLDDLPDRLVIELTEQEAVNDYHVSTATTSSRGCRGASGSPSTTPGPATRACGTSSSSPRIS